MNANDIVRGLQPHKKLPDFRVGDTLKVHVKILEGEKERIQVFEGTVIKRRRGGEGASFTVRKVSYGVGVERVFPFVSSAIEKIEVIQRGKVRRARLYYLRARTGKEANVSEAGKSEDSKTDDGSSSDSTPRETLKSSSREPASAPIS